MNLEKWLALNSARHMLSVVSLLHFPLQPKRINITTTIITKMINIIYGQHQTEARIIISKVAKVTRRIRVKNEIEGKRQSSVTGGKLNEMSRALQINKHKPEMTTK